MKYYVPYIIIAGLLIFILIRGCEPVKIAPLPKIINTDSIKNKLRAEMEELYRLRLLSQSASTSTVYVDKWHKAKHDTIPCEEKIIICDTAIIYLQDYNEALSRELKQANNVISTQALIIRTDSINTVTYKDSIKVLNKALSKANRKVILWKVLFGVSAAGNAAQALSN